MKRFCQCLGVFFLGVLLLTTSGCTKHARAARLLKSATRDFNEGKYEDAEVEYKGVMKLVGINATAIGQLGRIYAKDGRIIDARMLLLEATKREPNSLPFQLALGQIDIALRDRTNSFAIATRILAAQPTNEEAMLLLVDTFDSESQTRKILESLPHADQNPAYHIALGMLAIREKNMTEAGNELQLAVTTNPKSPEAHFALAQYYAMKKDASGATNALKAAADLAPIRSPIRTRYIDYLLKSGKGDDGRARLREMTEKAPDYLPGWIALMNLAMAEKKYDEAAKYADAVLSRDERNYEAMLGKGNVYLATSDGTKALDQFQRMDTLFKRSPQVKFGLAAAYLMMHDNPLGVDNLNRALEIDPTYPQAALLLGQLDIRSGDPGAAISMLVRYVKKSPGIAQARLLLADAYLADRKPENALNVYRSLSEALPKNPELHLIMGNTLAGEHKAAEAREQFEKALELAPDYPPAIEQMINLDLAERRYGAAEALVQEQIKKAPKASPPWELQAKVDLAQSKMSDAEADLQKAVALNPSLAGPYLMLAEVYTKAGKNDEALKKLNALVEQTNDITAYLQIAAINEQLKQYDKAGEAYEKVLSINSNSVPALNNVAYMYAVHLDKLDRAGELAQRVHNLLPYDPNIGDTLGLVLLKKNDYVHAMRIWEDGADKAPNDPEIQYHLGLAHYMLAEEDSARLALQRAVASSQDYVGKDDARAKLAILNMDTATASPSALADLEKSLSEQPDDPVLLNRVADIEERQGQTAKAAATYESILKKNPNALRVEVKLAKIYAYQLNQPDDAMRLATQAHKLAPDNAEASAILGHMVYRTAHSNDDSLWALSLLESAENGLANQPDVLYDLAWAYYSVGRIGDAENAMRKALALGVSFGGSEDANHFLKLADAYTSQAKIQSVAELAVQILQKDAKYVPAQMVYGAGAAIQGNYAQAQDSFARVLLIFPLFAPAERELAILDAQHFPNDADGFAVAQKAHAAYPTDTEVTKSFGILSYYQSQYQKSADALGETAARGKADGESYYYLGMDYSQLNRGKESKQALQKALALNIPDKLASAARSTLAQLK